VVYLKTPQRKSYLQHPYLGKVLLDYLLFHNSTQVNQILLLHLLLYQKNLLEIFPLQKHHHQKLDFFLQGELLKNEAKLLTAASYKLAKNYTAGINHLNTINLDGAADSLIYKVKYQCALMSYLNNDLVQAESFLQQLNYLVKDSSYISRSVLLNVIVLNEQYRWQQAKDKLYSQNKTDSLNSSETFIHKKKIIDSIYNIKLIPKLKSVEKASKMSTFFPGLGQCYAKNYGEGISSFLAISVTAGAMVVGIIYQYYFTSIFAGNLLIGKFYLGGIKRAEFLTEKYNYKKTKKYNAFLKDQIKQNLIN
jgi:hypothetical protein